MAFMVYFCVNTQYYYQTFIFVGIKLYYIVGLICFSLIPDEGIIKVVIPTGPLGLTLGIA